MELSHAVESEKKSIIYSLNPFTGRRYWKVSIPRDAIQYKLGESELVLLTEDQALGPDDIFSYKRRKAKRNTDLTVINL